MTETVELAAPDEVSAQIRSVADNLCFVAVADIRGEVDWGNLLIWLAESRAFLRLDEHREHYATDSTIGTAPDEVVRFRDEYGRAFEVPFAQTVSRGQPLDALDFWLTTGQRLPALEWS